MNKGGSPGVRIMEGLGLGLGLGMHNLAVYSLFLIVCVSLNVTTTPAYPIKGNKRHLALPM